MFRFLCCRGLVIVGGPSLKRLVVRARPCTRVYPGECIDVSLYARPPRNPRTAVRTCIDTHTHTHMRARTYAPTLRDTAARRNSALAILNEIRDHRASASRNEELVRMSSFPVLSVRPFMRMSLVARCWIKSFFPAVINAPCPT